MANMGGDIDTKKDTALRQALDKVHRKIITVDQNGLADTIMASSDQVIIEAPLQIMIAWFNEHTQNHVSRPLLVTMRTPGKDKELVAGLLFASSVVQNSDEISDMQHIEPHVLEVTLAKGIVPDWDKLNRQSMSFASCGVCGQQQVKQLAIHHPPVKDKDSAWLPTECVLSLPKQLSSQQALFNATGGVHGAGIWNEGSFVSVQEDVGRHNAVDKVIGTAFLECSTPVSDMLSQSVLVLSGRVSFELVQKAIIANIPVIVAIGAPSSLAIVLAKQFNITLVGFTKANQCNVYSAEYRLS